MNKIALTLGLAATVALGFSACDETWDDNPVVKAPNKEYTDFLNEPELRETWITISKEGADKNAALHMTCSQPDFGFAAVANYVVEVCLTPEFTKAYVDGETPVQGDYYSTETVFTDCAQINPIADEIAECVCKLKGWTSDEEVVADEYSKVYVRLRAYIPEAEELTTIWSQPQSFEHIRVTYYAASIPGLSLEPRLCIRGDAFSSWADSGLPVEDEFFTTAKRGIYVLPHVKIPKNSAFKFASDKWNPINLGAGASAKVGSAFRLDNSGGSGNLTLSDDFEGRVVLCNKGDQWQAILEQDGKFEADVLPKF